MPTYGYRCSDCKNEFETFQKMSDAALTTCEKCGGTLKKILYPVGISFKGEGFYVNDSAKSVPSGKKAAEKSEGAETPADSPSSVTPSGDSGGEAKPEKSATSETPAATTPAAS